LRFDVRSAINFQLLNAGLTLNDASIEAYTNINCCNYQFITITDIDANIDAFINALISALIVLVSFKTLQLWDLLSNDQFSY